MQFLYSPGPCSIELTDDDCAVAAVVNDAGLKIIGAEIDEAADRASFAHDFADHELVKPVLRRNHVTLRSKMGKQRIRRGTCVLCFHAQEDPLEASLEIGWQKC